MSEELFNTYPDLKRLQRRIRRSEGIFSLFFAECNLPTLRLELAEALSEKLQQEALFIELPLPQGQPIPFDEIIAEQVTEAPDNQAIFLFGLENWLPTSDQETLNQTTQQINWRRSAFARLNRPLVVWLPKYAVDLLAEYTPDFYDWYSGFFSFKAAENHSQTHIVQSLERFAGNTEVHHANRLNKQETLQWLHTLNALIEENNNEDKEHARLLNLAGLSYKKLGHYETALRYLEKSLSIRKKINDKIGEGDTLNILSLIFRSTGDYKNALYYLEKSLTIRKNIGDKKGEGTSINNIALIFKAKGDYETALQYLEESLVIRQEIGDKAGEGATLNNIALIFKTKKEYEIALDYLQKSLSIRQEIGDKAGEGTTLNNMAAIAHTMEDYRTALSYLEKSLTIRQEIGDKAGEGTTLNNISQIYDIRGDYKTALHYLKQSFFIQKEIGDKSGICVTLFNIAHIHKQNNELPKASLIWGTVYKIAKDIGEAQVLDALRNLASKLEITNWDDLATQLNLNSKSVDQLISEITV